MPFQEAIKTCLSKYATFAGRASRSEFWWFALFQFGVMVVLGMVSEPLSGVAALLLLLPAIAAGARRLHDIGKSGFFLLIGFIPVIGHLVLLYWFVQPSDGPNEFGNPEVTPYSPTVMPGPGQQ